MNALASLIAKIGTNPYFIAANAHCWFAFAVVTMLPSPWTLGIGLVLAAAKEFWFDATYERPPQTFLDNATDFAGYATGLALAAWRTGLL